MSTRYVGFEDTEWWTPPGHVASASKRIVGPKSALKTDRMDFRISIYQPGGYVEPHSHEEGEHVWYILGGRGMVILSGEKIVVKEGDTIHIPAGSQHSLNNTGAEPLYLMTILVPAEG